MQNIFVGSCYNNAPTANLKKHQVKDFEDFCNKFLKTCIKGGKFEHYITIGSDYEITKGDKEENPQSYKYNDHYHRNNRSQTSAWLLPFDGDNSISTPGSCVPPKEIHEILTLLKLNHVIYTTHSHIKDVKNRWRLFLPCTILHPLSLQPTVNQLFSTLKSGCPDLELSNESKTWSIPWYLPTRDDPDDGQFEYYTYFNGNDYEALPPTSPEFSNTTYEDAVSISDMISIIQNGSNPLHETLRNFIYGDILDGKQPAAVKAILHALTANYDMNDPRLKDRKNDIDRMVDITYKKYQESQSTEWDIENEQKNQRVYTRYPDQGNNFERMVQFCMEWMYFPNRQLAVTACHALISTLGGRVYTTSDGSGIVYTVLITGRSTIGKSSIKDFCVFVLNNVFMNNLAGDYIGSHYYTSGANLIKELSRSGSLLSIRTESGQSDMSTAGDMKRVTLYELELATKSGKNGYISSGGQNDKVPDLYSPAVTTVRESVAEIQNKADIANMVNVSGTSGRRSHVIIDPIKPYYNRNRITILPKWFKEIIRDLYKLSKDEKRKQVDKPLPDELWTVVLYENPKYLLDKQDVWVDKENKEALKKDHFMSTFYGRLHEKVPAYAARLAIADNPLNPVINNTHIDIAENSLLAEVLAFQSQENTNDPWALLIEDIVDIFSGDLKKKKTLRKIGKKALEDGAIEWTYLKKLLMNKDYFKALSTKDNFEFTLTKKLEYVNIYLMSKEDTMRLYKKRSKIYRRE